MIQTKQYIGWYALRKNVVTHTWYYGVEFCPPITPEAYGSISIKVSLVWSICLQEVDVEKEGESMMAWSPRTPVWNLWQHYS